MHGYSINIEPKSLGPPVTHLRGLPSSSHAPGWLEASEDVTIRADPREEGHDKGSLEGETGWLGWLEASEDITVYTDP